MHWADDWRDVSKVPTAVTVPGVLVVRYQSPLFFANADGFRAAVEDLIDAADLPVRLVVFDAAATSYATAPPSGASPAWSTIWTPATSRSRSPTRRAARRAHPERGTGGPSCRARRFPTVDAAFRELVGAPKDRTAYAVPYGEPPTATTPAAPAPTPDGATA